MNRQRDSVNVASMQFTNAAGALATQFGWPAKFVERDDETVVVALTASDPDFDRMIWTHESEAGCVRCLLVSKLGIPAARRMEVLELCARINEGLRFGCVEYSFADDVVVFRDSAELPAANLDQTVEATTARLLALAERYAPALKRTLAGETPLAALA